MSYPPPRQTTLPSHSHIRPSSGLANTTSSHASSTQANALQARIAEKKAELAHLQQLRDLSAGLAGQMQQLEAKVATLRDGTGAVAEVLANWHGVLRAVWLASAKIPKPADEQAGGEEETPLPQTLVRIPIRQAEDAQREGEGVAVAEAGE